MKDTSLNYAVTAEQAKNSVECRYRKYQFRVLAILAAIIVAIYAIPLIAVEIAYSDDNHIGLTVFIIIAVIFLSVFLPFILYQYFCYRRVIRVADKCAVYRVKLDKAHGSFWHRGASVFYTVSFDTEEGSVTVDTTALFSTGTWFASTYMEDYNNKDVYVLYNKDDQSVYVLDLVEKIKIVDNNLVINKSDD